MDRRTLTFLRCEPNALDKCFQRAMIADWRKSYGADIPFVFVQLQPCGIPPEMRYAQAQALTKHSGLPAVGMASCYDLGDADPLNAMGLCHSRCEFTFIVAAM